VAKRRSKGEAIRGYFDPLSPQRKRRRTSYFFLGCAVFITICGAVLLLLLDSQLPLRVIGYPVLVVAVVFGFVGALMFADSLITEFRAIQFIRERMVERCKDLPEQYKGYDVTLAFPDSSAWIVVSGYCLTKVGEHEPLLIPDGHKGLYSSNFEAHAFLVYHDQLIVLTRRFCLYTVEPPVETHTMISLKDIKAVEARETMHAVTVGGKTNEGVYRYLEISTRDRQACCASLSFFDPLDERKELSFDAEVKALQAAITSKAMPSGSCRQPS